MGRITISVLATYVICGVIGFLLGRSIKAKPRTPWLVSLAIFAVLSQWILVGTRVVDIFGFQIFANQVLQALSCGVLTGLLTKRAN